MSDLTPQQQQLMTDWQDLHQNTEQVLDWVTEVRASAPKLNDAANSINLKLHRARNLAQDLGRVAGTPMTMGFFGLSQAGKSYLISALAADENGELETVYDGETLNFLKHVNPVGGGKESTGLVTRFSRTAKQGPNDFPIELKLFSEIELAKILTNCWFNDFNHEKVEYELNEQGIGQVLERARTQVSLQLQAGVTADEVVSLWDYVNDSFEKSVAKLEHSYWPEALKLAPRLSSEHRAELFSILWGEETALTKLYIKLATILQQLQDAAQVFAPLDVLMMTEERDGSSQRVSIMNVDILERLDGDNDYTIAVRPVKEGKPLAPVSITMAELAALTAELTFPLVNPTRDPIVEQVDLLDFPGYRGRLSMTSLNEDQSEDKNNPVTQLLLRGKVAYLFERYTDSQEMNCLVVCTSSDKQSDVNDVGPILTRWIEKTQGKDAAERGQREPGLMWAITMCDKLVAGAMGHEITMLNDAWENLIKMTMQERFGHKSWMQNWTGGRPFNNTFMVRKPRMEVSFIELRENTNEELKFAERCRSQLDLMKETFSKSSLISKHIAEPSAAWDAMMELDSGGIQRISQHLSKVANIDFKLQRIQEQFKSTQKDIHDSLIGWYSDGIDGAVEAQQVKAGLLLPAFKDQYHKIGNLLHHLQLDDAQVRELYLSRQSVIKEEVIVKEKVASPSSAVPLDNSRPNLDGLFGLQDTGDKKEDSQLFSNKVDLETHEHRFAQAVFSAWVGHLGSLSKRPKLLNILELSSDVMDCLAGELITASYRHNILERLTQAAINRSHAGARREELVQGQVLSAQLVLGDFIAWFGELELPIAERNKQLIGAEAPLYSYEIPLKIGELPTLARQPIDQAKRFGNDWCFALYHNILANAGHSAGREITLEQNAWLGTVLTPFSSENAS